MLVVVEHRDFHFALERFLDDEAFGRLDVFEVDAAEGRFHALDDFDDVGGVRSVKFDVENVDVGEPFEQHALSFHDGLSRQRADVSQAQHGRAVADHRHEVPARRVFRRKLGVALDFLARLGNSRRICQGKVALGLAWFRRDDLDFPLAALRMVG